MLRVSSVLSLDGSCACLSLFSPNHLQAAAGSPPHVQLIELGPGKGTMMSDMLRAMKQFLIFPTVSVHMVEGAGPRMLCFCLARISLLFSLLLFCVWHGQVGGFSERNKHSHILSLTVYIEQQ